MADSVITSLVFIVQLVLLVGFFALIYRMFYYPERAYDRIFSTLAAKYGLLYQRKGEIAYKGIILGRVGRVMHSNDPSDYRQLALFHYTHETGSGKSRRIYQRTVVAVPVNPTGVHLFINSELNDMEETPNLDKSQRYEAEGTFGKYFDMYFPGGKQIEALSIFAPDVLALIMGKFGEYDMEIVDDVLYLYAYEQSIKQDVVENVLLLAKELAQAVNSNTPRTLLLTRTSQARQREGVPILRLQGKQIGVATILTVVGFVLLYLVNIFNFQDGIISPILIFILVIGSFVSAVVRTGMIARKKKDYQKERQLYLSTRK